VKGQDLIDLLERQIRGQIDPAPDKVEANGDGHAPRRVSGDDATILQKARAAKNAHKFEALFDRGDTTGHGGDDSRADLALLGLLKYWTQDPAQLERIFSASALGQRDKWRRRPDYRRRTVEKALAELGEVYDWSKNERGRYIHRSLHSIGRSESESCGEGDEEATRASTRSISFAELPEPEKPEEVWQGIIVRGWPALWFGGTGVTKSTLAAAIAQAIADEHTKVFLGLDVITAPVMYADWELNPQVQGRRAYQIARARGRLAPPPTLRYMSTYGLPRRARQDFTARVLEECIDHKSEVCVIDSVGLAVSGNPGDFEVVVEFFEEVVAAFVAEGITPVLIDHQRRMLAGERNQALGAYGSVWKENLARTQLQIELVSRDRKAHTVTTRLRAKKTNFDELPEPLEVLTTFAENAIKLEAITTEDVDRASEETLNADERVLAAIRAAGEGGAGPGELTETCATLKRATVQNAISRLRGKGEIENTGEFEGRAHKVRVVSPFTSPNKREVNSERADEPGQSPTQRIATMLADPPDWLVKQLGLCRKDPDRLVPPTCKTIAIEAYGDHHRWEEVRPVLEAHLAEEASEWRRASVGRAP
jgi:hypothetical protein